MKGIFTNALSLALILSVVSTSLSASNVLDSVKNTVTNTAHSLAHTTPADMAKAVSLKASTLTHDFSAKALALKTDFDAKATETLKWAADNKMEALDKTVLGTVVAVYAAIAGYMIYKVYKVYQERKQSRAAYGECVHYDYGRLVNVECARDAYENNPNAVYVY